jgi:hypothetical protein
VRRDRDPIYDRDFSSDVAARRRTPQQPSSQDTRLAYSGRDIPARPEIMNAVTVATITRIRLEPALPFLSAGTVVPAMATAGTVVNVGGVNVNVPNAGLDEDQVARYSAKRLNNILSLNIGGGGSR